jgi:hypothetical protein
MTRLHDDRTALEEGATAMLHRLAADARVDPPLWNDLIARRDRVVVPLPVGDRITDRSAAPPFRWYSPRAGLAAAAVIAVVIAGVLVVDRGPDTASPSTEPITVITPADASFDAEAADAVWATGAPDALSATATYLHTLGIPTDPSANAAAATAAARGVADEAADGAAGATESVAGVATLSRRSDDGTTAVVDWSLDGASGTTGGTVHLRSSALPVSAGSAAAISGGGDAAAHGWVVVGSSAVDVALDGVSYDGENLAVDVSRTVDAGDPLAIAVWVNGQPASIGGEVVVDAAGDLALGEAVEIGDAAGSDASLAVAVERDDVVTMRVVHVIEGHVRSVTQMALALPDAAPEAATEIAAGVARATGTATAGAGSATGGSAGSTGTTGSASAETGTDAGASGHASAQGDAGVSGSAGGEVLPGVTVPTLPPLQAPEDLPLPVPTTTPGAGILP